MKRQNQNRCDHSDDIVVRDMTEALHRMREKVIRQNTDLEAHRLQRLKEGIARAVEESLA